MPFGLHRAVATFQRFMDRMSVLHQDYMAAYINDIVILTGMEGYRRALRAVLGELRKVSLTANPKKCAQGKGETRYFRFLVGKGQI